MIKTCGLTLGKYAPFHKGHQLLINTALAEMDELIVLVYDAPETTSIPLNIRSNWIKKLYPQVKVLKPGTARPSMGKRPKFNTSMKNTSLKTWEFRGSAIFIPANFMEST